MTFRLVACKNCKHFVPDDPTEIDSFQGKCHQSRPTHKGFPPVYLNDWCSKFKDRAQERKPPKDSPSQ